MVDRNHEHHRGHRDGLQRPDRDRDHLGPGGRLLHRQVRIRDAAGNWSAGSNGVRTAPLSVGNPPPDAIFSNGFETGPAPWGWTSRSSTSTTRLNVDGCGRAHRQLGPPGPGQQHQLCSVQLWDGRQPGDGDLRRPLLRQPQQQRVDGSGRLRGRDVEWLRHPAVPPALPPERHNAAGPGPGRRHRESRMGPHHQQRHQHAGGSRSPA